MYSILQRILLFTVAVYSLTIVESNPTITEFTISATDFPKMQSPETITIQDLIEEDSPCPYAHIRHEQMRPTLMTITTHFARLNTIKRRPIERKSPKVIASEPKKEIPVTEELLQGYMKEMLDTFDSMSLEPSKWRENLRELTQKISSCKKTNDPSNSPGLTLTAFANEVKKASRFLKFNYRILRAELYEIDRASALKAFEQQLLQIHHDMSVAVHLHKKAAILEQKWRTYFLVNLAEERFAPLELDDHKVFGLFCQIYSLAHKEPIESPPTHDKPEDKISCSKNWIDSFFKLQHYSEGSHSK